MYRLAKAADQPVQKTVTPYIMRLDSTDQTIPEYVDSGTNREPVHCEHTIGRQTGNFPALYFRMTQIYLIGRIHQITVSHFSGINTCQQSQYHAFDPDMIYSVQIQYRFVFLVKSHSGCHRQINTDQQP